MKNIKDIIRTWNPERQAAEMVLRQNEADATAVRKFVPSSIGVEWVSKQLDAEGKPVCVRKPEQEKSKFLVEQGFFAAGKAYRNIQQLTVQKVDDYLCKDTYGREVLCFRERFPCFDSYDYLYEDRYFRWFFIRERDSVTMVYTEDTRPEIQVTEDIRQIPRKWWETIQKYWG